MWFFSLLNYSDAKCLFWVRYMQIHCSDAMKRNEKRKICSAKWEESTTNWIPLPTGTHNQWYCENCRLTYLCVHEMRACEWHVSLYARNLWKCSKWHGKSRYRNGFMVTQNDIVCRIDAVEHNCCRIFEPHNSISLSLVTHVIRFYCRLPDAVSWRSQKTLTYHHRLFTLLSLSQSMNA